MARGGGGHFLFCKVFVHFNLLAHHFYIILSGINPS